MSHPETTPLIQDVTPAAARPSKHCTLRERWATAVLAGLGAGFSSLLFIGIAYEEHSMGEFLLVVLLLGTVSYIFFDEVVHLAYESMGMHVSEVPGHRKLLVVAMLSLVTFAIVSLHKLVDAGVEKDITGSIAILITALIVYGSITSAWIKGAQQDPPCAARKGAIRGLIMAAILFLLILLVFAALYIQIIDPQATFAGTLPDVVVPVFVKSRGRFAIGLFLLFAALITEAIVALQFVLLGLFGGLAIDKKWTGCPTRGVMYVLVTAAILIGVVPFLIVSIFLKKWEPDWLQTAFVLWGWSASLVIKGRTCNRLLDVSPPTAAGSGQVDHNDPHLDGWRPTLAFGMVLVLLLGAVKWWRGPSVHVDSVSFFESGQPGLAKEDRIYQSRFRQQTTRFLNYELHLKRELSAANTSLTVRWSIQNGQLQSRTDKLTPNKDPANPLQMQGFGPRQWKTGTYTVEFLENDTKVGSGKFDIISGSPEVRSINFFEGTDGQGRQQIAIPHFRADLARFIYFDLHLSDPVTTDMPLKITWRGEQAQSNAQFHLITSGSEGLISGLGSPQPGSWSPGRYSVSFSLTGQKQGQGDEMSGEFFIDPAPFAFSGTPKITWQQTQMKPLPPPPSNQGQNCCDCGPELTNLQCFTKCNALLPRCTR
jgi:hypothetical protein